MAAKGDTSPYQRAVTELTGVDPARFMGRRKEIAQELRQAGDRDGAASVLAIRKPSATVASANEVARYDPERTEALLAAARELEAAQQSVFAGTRGGADLLRSASAAFQQALDRVATQAGKIPGSRAKAEPLRRQLRDLLAAAALGPEETRGDLARGRMLGEPPPLGFGGLGVGVSVQGPRASGETTRAAQPKRDAAAERRARHLNAARDRLNAALVTARDAAARAARVEMEARRAEAEAGKLRREAETARSRAEESRHVADRLAAEVDQLK